MLQCRSDSPERIGVDERLHVEPGARWVCASRTVGPAIQRSKVPALPPDSPAEK